MILCIEIHRSIGPWPEKHTFPWPMIHRIGTSMRKTFAFIVLVLAGHAASFAQQPADCINCMCTMPMVLGTTITTSSTHGPCDGENVEFNDVDVSRYMRFWAIAGNEYTISFCDNTADTYIYLATNTTIPGVIACNDDGCGAPDGPASITFFARTTTIYRIYVFNAACGTQYPQGTLMDLSIVCNAIPVPANDQPCDAITLLTSDCQTMFGNTWSASNMVGMNVPACGQFQGADVWYTLPVPANGVVHVSIEHYSMCSAAFQLYTTTDCAVASAFTPLPEGCSIPEGGDLIGPSLIYDAIGNGLQPGDWIYIRVWERNGNENGSFGICAGEWYGTIGQIHVDDDQDCVMDDGEQRLNGKIAVIQPGDLVVTTGPNGMWTVQDLPPGEYTITSIPAGPFGISCGTSQTFLVTDPDSLTIAPPIGWVINDYCALPDVQIAAPIIRRCFSNNVTVAVCNQANATGVLGDPVVNVQLPAEFTVNGASLPYTDLGNNLLQFQLDQNVFPGDCINFTINHLVSCDAEMGQTLCMTAELVGATACADPSPPIDPECPVPYDGSDLHLSGICNGNNVVFTVLNAGAPGSGDMDCGREIRVFADTLMIHAEIIQLAGGASQTFSYEATGATFTLQADQHPGHPNSSQPIAHVELCGPESNWSLGMITQFPQDDHHPIIDTYCGVVTTSYDPNDKAGSPSGIGDQHSVVPGQRLEYMIRFQNTGNDTAFTVVIRDTLSMAFDLFSLVPGITSHDHSFRIYGPRVLEWTFDNILLPDSNVNEPASHGFVMFSVDQAADLPLGTQLVNTADIYFDFNEPVITNTTLHTVNLPVYPDIVTATNVLDRAGLGLNIWPNPVDHGSVQLYLECAQQTSLGITILDAQGRYLTHHRSIVGINGVHTIKLSEALSSGAYLVKAMMPDGSERVGKLLVK